MSYLLRAAPHELCAYEAPVSLWGLVETYVPRHEWQEVKLILGESLVEQSLELQEEVRTLLEIWRDYRDETDNQPMFHRLPEPPEARDRLKQEIKFFVDSVREKSGNNGRNIVEILTKHNKQVLDYVLEDTNIGRGRPSTARNQCDGRETPAIPPTPDRLSLSSTVSDEVESMQDNLNYLKLDEVVQHLRETIAQEVEWLMADIEFLQGCLEEEVDFRSQAHVSREPTLTDLREERSKLEKELLTPDIHLAQVLNASKSPPVPMKAPAPILRGSPLALSGSPSKVSPPKPAPLKASHSLSTQVLTLQPPRQALASTPLEAGTSKRFGASRESPQTSRAAPSKPLTHSHHGDHDGAQDSALQRRLLSEIPSHVSVRTATLSNNTRVVAVSASDGSLHTPTPPSTAKPAAARSNSAQRFRKMVSQCRDQT